MMAIKFEDRKSTEKAFKNFEKMVTPLRIKVDGDYFCETDEPMIVDALPRYIETPRHAMEYTFIHNLHPPTVRLGNIAYSEYNNIVVLDISHLMSDGKIMKIYFDNCLSDKLPNVSKVPLPPLYLDENIIKYIKHPQADISNKVIKVPFRNKHANCRMLSTRITTKSVDTKNLINWDKKTNHLSRFTDYLYSTWILSLASMENMKNIDGKTSMFLATDLRKYLRDPNDLTYGMNSNSLSVDVDGHFDTIGQMQDEFRRSLNDKMKKRIDLLVNSQMGTAECNFPVVTCPGPHYFKRPIVDFEIGPMSGDFFSGYVIYLGCYGKINETMNQVDIHLGCAPYTYDGQDFETLLNKVEHCLTKFDRNTTIKEALKELEQFQSHKFY